VGSWKGVGVSKDWMECGAMIELSEDQEVALLNIRRALSTGKRASVLVGAAGTGKTTLMQYVIGEQERRREVVLICPTGKAASVLGEKTGRAVQTVHQALYSRVTEHEGDEELDEHGDPVKKEVRLMFHDPHPPCGTTGLVICDEASMVSSRLHRDLLGQIVNVPGAQLLYVGDREQLPPVNDTWGPNFDSPDAALTVVHRQAEKSPILRLATAIRTGRGFADWGDGCDIGPGDPIRWLTERVRAGVDVTLLAYTNATRRRLNSEARDALGLNGRLCVRDRIVCCLNNRDVGMMNGETGTITHIGPSTMRGWAYARIDDGESVLVNRYMLGASSKEFKEATAGLSKKARPMALHIDIGWCLTVHKAQGSEWKSVGFVADDGYRRLKLAKVSEARRLAYTAVTRASEELYVFDET
jgi:exodeoxyribonuclease V